MPTNHSPAVSRRSFLSMAAVGAGSVILTPRCLQAAGKNRPPLSFIVVSDTHLGYRDKAAAAKQWGKTAAEVAKSNGDLVLHLGDVVDGGRENQYPIYLKTRNSIGKPVHEIPGNHDPQPLFEKYIRKQIDTTVDLKWLRFLLVGNAHTDSHDGFLEEEQIEWIDRQCRDAANRDMFVAICMHVPAHKNRHPDRGWYVKPNHGQTALYKTIERHQDRILALMHGHFHNGIRGWNDHAPVHEILFPSVLYNLDRKLEQQKAPGYNLPEFRPGFTKVTIDGGEMKLTYQPVGSKETAEKKCELPQLT